MQINISTTSWHVKVFQWYFRGNRPQSLCPYFWGWMLILPTTPLFLILGWPAYLWVWIEKKAKDEDQEPHHPGIMALIGTVIMTVIFLLTATVIGIVHLFRHVKINEDTQALLFIEALVALIIFATLIYRFVEWCISKTWGKKTIYNNYNVWFRTFGKDWESHSKYDWELWVRANKPTTSWQLIRQGVRAVYKKACPIINWQ